MRKLDTSNISTTVAFPVKSGTFDHLQLANQEAFNAIGRQFIGPSYDATKVYVVYGCVNSTPGGSTFTISAGCVFFNGEFYLVDAVTFTAGGGQTAVATIVTTYNVTNADPVTFTDGVARNVHQIRKVVIAAANTGTGTSDYSDFATIDPAWISLPTAVFSQGTGTISSQDAKTKRIKDTAFVRYEVAFNTATGSGSGFVSLTITLPYAVSNGPIRAITYGGAIIATASAYSNTLELTYYTDATGGHTVFGQIFYEVA